MSLLNVPNEVILLVAFHLEYEGEINAFCRTTRRLHKLLNPLLYKRCLNRRNGGYTLEWAAMNGSVSTGRFILEAGAPPDACGCRAWQPFALAATHGHSEMITLLYERGVDPCSATNDWKNHLDDESDLEDWEDGHPLSMAASSGHLSVVHQLLKYGVPPDLPTGKNESRAALHLAAEGGHLDIVRVLIDAGSPVNGGGFNETPLAVAAREGHLEIVQFLLSRGAVPNIVLQYSGTSLCEASGSGNIDIVRCLLDHGATPNPNFADGRKPLYQLARAAERGYDDILDLLLSRFDYIKSSTEPYQQGVLLCVAALTGRTSLLTDLLATHHYDPNLRVVDGTIFRRRAEHYYPTPSTALTWAAHRNQAAAIDILLAHGASLTLPRTEWPNPRSTRPETPPLIRAIQKGHREAIATLLAHGANPNDPPGEPLFNAVTNPPVFALLLAHPAADPAIAPPNASLLAHVLQSGNLESLRLLLAHPQGPSLIVDPVPSGSRAGPQSTSLFRLAICGGEPILRFLIDQGILIPPNPKEIPPRTAGDLLILAARRGGIPTVRFLLDLGFDIRSGDNIGSLVHTAAAAPEDPEGRLLDFVLQRGCHIDDTDNTGKTALVCAAYKREESVARRLLARGADPFLRHGQGTALTISLSGRWVGAVKAILDAFDERGLKLEEVEEEWRRAERTAVFYEREGPDSDVVRVLRRWYWRRRYPVPSS